ncbi:hypothetical protein FH972_026215 [Carpinus fangiana]|uniref:Clu domain-containing protein n=1 Tax=Carpinus fangiana TaxID=176857 RepID=A0A5N6L4B1_9ROSI|nr:hypothetical protein FH972_026215 [Carpinus fangiana]
MAALLATHPRPLSTATPLQKVSTQEQAQDIRQAIIDVPDTFQYSCFHLEHNGERITDFVDLADIPGIAPDCELVLVEDPYTEKDARLHVLRIRDLIAAAGDHTDLVQGLHAGLSLHDSVMAASPAAEDSSTAHSLANYDINSQGSFDALQQPTQGSAPKTLKSISLSPWNPPPYHLRSKGHLLYLQVTTNEGEQHQITSHVTGFYLNKSSNSKFDPFPRTTPKEASAHSLLTLIERLSPSFDMAFKALQAHNGKRDPLSAFQLSNAIPASPWIVPQSSSQLAAHTPDISRTQESYLIAGADNAETLRDWNEEFQTTRELPRDTVQDRVFRERVTSKLFADYNEAATKGAVLIARGEVAPLNPTEPVDAQIFVYNNVFYSFGADGVGTFANEGGDEAARAATGKDVMGVKTVNQLDIDGLSTPGTIIVDFLGKRIVGQSIVPGIFKQREPELIDAYWRLKLREYVREQITKNGSEKEPETHNGAAIRDSENAVSKDGVDVDAERKAVEQERVDISGFNFSLNPDVFCGQEPQTEQDIAEWTDDEAAVRAVGEYLHSEVMPRLIVDLQEGDVGFPMDGQSLSSLLHKRGINIRYLGKVAELASKPEPRLDALKSLAEQEMVARAFKHAANRYLRTLAAPFAPACIAHMLNCLLGMRHNPSPKAETNMSMRALYPEDDFEYEKLTPNDFQKAITEQVSLRYRYELSERWLENLKPVQMLREISLKFGLQMIAREYHFEKSIPPAVLEGNGHLAPSTNGHVASGKKKNRKADHSPVRAVPMVPTLPAHTFHADDILNIVPVLKEASPRSVLAEEALEAGRISLARNEKELGQELLLESLSLHEQIYGILHVEVARVYYQLSSLFFSLEDKAIAVELARKAVIVSERTLGVDNNETVLAYLNLGLFEHALGNTQMALTYVRHALDLWKIVYGPKHPDSITTINNAAVMLQHLKLYHDSRAWFETSLDICVEISGKKSVNTATLLFQLAQALALDQNSREAVNRMREAFTIFSEVLGPNDRNTKEAETWLEQLTQNAVSIAKHAKDVQARRLRQLQHRASPSMAMGMRPQRQVGQTEREATDVAPAGGRSGLDERSVEELLRYIEGGEQSKSSKSTKRPANPKRRQQAAA